MPAATQCQQHAQSSRQVRKSPFFMALVSLLCCSFTGCSLFVMAGKMIWGDPKVTCGFRSMTGVDLTKGEKNILVVVTTPEFIKGDMPALDADLIDEIYRRFKRQGISVIDPDDVLSWIDSIGGDWSDPSELAEEFDADYIAHFDIEDFRYRQPNSPGIYRGHASGSTIAYQVVELGDSYEAQQVFVSDFRIDYPRMNPVSSDQVSEKVFQRNFVTDLSNELSRHFFDFRLGDGY